MSELFNYGSGGCGKFSYDPQCCRRGGLCGCGGGNCGKEGHSQAAVSESATNSNQTLEAERAAPCPLCQSDQVQICRDSNNRSKDYARCRECKCTGPLSIWNRRPSPAEVGELPPLPEPKYCADDLTDIYTVDQIRDYARDAIDAYAARCAGDAVTDSSIAQESVIACAQRVYSKFGQESDWSEWRDLGAALQEYANAAAPSPVKNQEENT